MLRDDRGDWQSDGDTGPYFGVHTEFTDQGGVLGVALLAEMTTEVPA